MLFWNCEIYRVFGYPSLMMTPPSLSSSGSTSKGSGVGVLDYIEVWFSECGRLRWLVDRW